jgi:outer membrane protein TolC
MRLRRRALEGVRAHDDAAQRMLKAGVISQVERLQASAALADAQQQSRKADDDARLAQCAGADGACRRCGAPQLPLFVSSEALPPLLQFLDSALNHHPGLSQVAAKQRQAASLHDASEALRKPQVLAFGLREVNTTGKPSWVAGVAVRWTLWDSIDRDKLSAAGLRKVEQAELMMPRCAPTSDCWSRRTGLPWNSRAPSTWQDRPRKIWRVNCFACARRAERGHQHHT